MSTLNYQPTGILLSELVTENTVSYSHPHTLTLTHIHIHIHSHTHTYSHALIASHIHSHTQSYSHLITFTLTLSHIHTTHKNKQKRTTKSKQEVQNKNHIILTSELGLVIAN